MQPLFVAVPATQIASDGTADIRLDTGWPASGISKWNLVLTLARGVVTVFAGSTPIAGPMPVTNGGITFSGIVSVSTDQIHIRIASGTPGDTATGSIRGGSGATIDDVAGVAAVASSTQGSAQNDPSVLLAGQVGDPLVENAGFQIPNKNQNPNFVTFPTSGSFDVSGYGTLFIVGDPNTLTNALFMQVQWFDSLGNLVDYDQVDALVPAFAFCLAAKGRRVSITLFNADTVNHGVANFSVIPLVQIPARPEMLIPSVGGSFGTFNPARRGVLIDGTGTAVLAGNFAQLNANLIWPGKAIWHIGQLTGGGSTNFNATLQCTDALGNTVVIARAGGVALPVVQEVHLSSGQAQILYFNTGTGTQTITASLVATS